MKMIDKIGDINGFIQVIQIEEDLFVDVKENLDEHLTEEEFEHQYQNDISNKQNYMYIMDLEDGNQVYDNTYKDTNKGIKYKLNYNEVIEFVEEHCNDLKVKYWN